MVAIHKPAHDIILKPVVSEKSYALSDRGQYTFVVAPNANKVQIKQAIEEIFNVKVTNVNTLNRAGKHARHARLRICRPRKDPECLQHCRAGTLPLLLLRRCDVHLVILYKITLFR